MATKPISFTEGTEPSDFSKNFSTFSIKTKKYLSCTDVLKNSNKFWAAELHLGALSKSRILTNYGRTGGTIAKEVRYFDTESEADLFLEKIVKEKTKKGYVEVAIVKADVGSDEGKSHIEPSKVSIEDIRKTSSVEESTLLHKKVYTLVKDWFGITSDYIYLNLDTTKCPLGQLSMEQITKGKELLEKARAIIHGTKSIDELNKITNLYYSNIPHNFGYNRINVDTIRLDSDIKVDKAYDFLDVLFDSKNIDSITSTKSNIDTKYNSLNSEINYVDPVSDTYKWIELMFQKTRASNHHFLGEIRLLNVFSVNRKDEKSIFIKNAEKIASECGKYNPSNTYKKLIENRPDVLDEYKDLYRNANILPGWHGTRRANMIGITTNGFLIRPSGVVHSGSMYGDGVYFATNSSKSINYVDCKGSYWASGTSNNGYLFLCDVAFGNSTLASSSKNYSLKMIKPNHSVWAKAGSGGVINDELIVYNPSGKNQQHLIKYVLEFETLVK